MKGPRNKRLFDADAFKQKSRAEGLIVALRKEIVTVATKAADSTEEIPKVDFVLSTASIDRSKDTINQDGWILDPYKKNPVVLWAHDGEQLPVGKAPLVVAEKADGGTRLVSRGTEFTPRELNESGWAVGQMYLKGFLNAVSVGFLPHTYQFNEERGGWAVDFLTQELLEFSCVPVPANPEALIGAKSAGIPIGWVVDWAEKILDVKQDRDDFESPARAYVEQLRKTVAPATFVVPAAKDDAADADAAADEAILEALGNVEAAIIGLTEAVKADTADRAGAREAKAQTSAPVTIAPISIKAPPSSQAVAAAVRSAVDAALANLTGRTP